MIRQELPACSYRGSTGSPKLIIYGHLPSKTPVRFSADGLATSTSSPLKTPSPVSPGGPALPASLPSSFTACSSLLTCQVTGTCMARISRSCRTSAVNGRSRRRTICLHLPSTGTAPWHSIGGRIRQQLSWPMLRTLGEEIGIPSRLAASVIREQLAAAGNWIGQLDQLPFDADSIRNRRRLVRARVGHIQPDR
jgi:hypothetical protein